MYDLELNNITSEIKKRKCRQVFIQLPDGLKPKADEIVEHIEKNSKAKAFIWLSSCYGGCDIPQGLEALKIDLVVQFGHNRFYKTNEGW